MQSFWNKIRRLFLCPFYYCSYLILRCQVGKKVRLLFWFRLYSGRFPAASDMQLSALWVMYHHRLGPVSLVRLLVAGPSFLSDVARHCPFASPFCSLSCPLRSATSRATRQMTLSRSTLIGIPDGHSLCSKRKGDHSQTTTCNLTDVPLFD
jgi:hypothetical protein